MSFQGELGSDPDPSYQVVTMQLAGDRAPYVAYGFLDGEEPQWLAVEISDYSGQTAGFVFRVDSAWLGIGAYETTVIVATLDENQEVLHAEYVHIGLVVEQSLRFSAAPVSLSMVRGSSNHFAAKSANVLAAGKRWRAESAQSWIQLPTDVFSGSDVLNYSVDSTGVPSGVHAGSIRIVNVDNPEEDATLAVTLQLRDPRISFTPVGFSIIGGYDGTEPWDVPQDLGFTLDTGTREHPWSLEILDPGGTGHWLAVSRSGGTVAGAGDALQLSADASGMRFGAYAAQLRLTVDVDGLPVATTYWVYLRIAMLRLVPDTHAVALHDVGGRQLLERSIVVADSRQLGAIPWTAEVDQPWLSVTPAGSSGEPLTIQADASALAPEAAHAATITLRSSDSRVDRAETIRVVLWKGAGLSTLSIPVSADYIAMNPADPLVYTHHGGTAFAIHHAMTGELVTTIANAGQQLGAMALSGDGRRLFILDIANPSVGIFDAATGAFVQRKSFGYGSMPDAASTLHWRRIGGSDLLISDVTLDLETGATFYSPLLDQGRNTMPQDGRRVVYTLGSLVGIYPLNYLPLGGGYLDLVGGQPYTYIDGQGFDIALSEGGTIFVASNPDVIDVLDSEQIWATHETIALTGTVNNVEQGWNDRIYAGVVSGGASAIHVIENRVAGASVETGAGALVPGTLRVSGDGLRAAVLQDDESRQLTIVTLP